MVDRPGDAGREGVREETLEGRRGSRLEPPAPPPPPPAVIPPPAGPVIGVPSGRVAAGSEAGWSREAWMAAAWSSGSIVSISCVTRTVSKRCRNSSRCASSISRSRRCTSWARPQRRARSSASIACSEAVFGADASARRDSPAAGAALLLARPLRPVALREISLSKSGRPRTKQGWLHAPVPTFLKPYALSTRTQELYCERRK
mmetsp:Transcript_46864/g.151042  ORF Transcript_46864/g.151042 Transcript_46864/m.151042 type:complete len:203 (-) Transcript_46864:263-871(-)